MKIRAILFFILMVNLPEGYAQSLSETNRTDLNLLAGLWFEIALYPAGLRNDCHCTTVEYEYIPVNRYIKSTTRCIHFKKGTPKMSAFHSKLIFKSEANDYKKKFQTAGLIRVDYEIILLTSDYRLAVIVNSKKKHLSLLSRDSFIPSHKYNEILMTIKNKGFNTQGIVKTSQNCDITE